MLRRSQRGVSIRQIRSGIPDSATPLNEQKRIADKLDAVLARVDACRERLDRVPAILKRFRRAVLAAATSGKLTEEWREQSREIRGRWDTLRLSRCGPNWSRQVNEVRPPP